jgi:hypothetical protein
MSFSIEDAFAEGVLVRPSDQRANLVHLVRALASVCGVPDVPGGDAITRIMSLIGPAEHVVFVLLDGLGMNLLRRLDGDSFLASSLKMELHAVAPSTTACALTSVATACYPARHGVTGWFTYEPELDLTVMMLPFAERYNKRPLAERNITAEQLLPVPAFLNRMTHRPLTLLPAPIADTAYARYSRGYTDFLGYVSIPHAIDQIAQHVMAATSATYTHLYLPDVDTLCHHVGVDQPGVLPLVHRIETELQRLADALGGRARIVISADHGLIDVPRPQQTALIDGDPLLAMLVVPPSGDARMPIFHVRQDRHGEFVEEFTRRMGSSMYLVPTEHAERLRLFGPEEMSAVARRRFGDYIAIPYRAATLFYAPPGTKVATPYIGQHAGLSPQEMHIPLCIV